jgi:phytoene dehydrogenase-like protein
METLLTGENIVAQSLIIIGAGIAGLATGCYAQMNGYRTQIYELHDKPGGLCTAWKRKGYTFDGCIHHLAGAGPTSKLYPLWEELGAVQGRQMMYLDELVRVEGPDGRAFTVYTDLDRLEQHMLELAPADAAVSRAYIAAARRFRNMELLAMMNANAGDIIRMLPLVPAIMQWGKLALGDYAQRFTDPLLRQAFPWIQYDFPNMPSLVNLAFLAGCQNQHLGWPVGGSLEFARAIERRYRNLGGEVHYKARVDKVLVETTASGTDRAVGVRLADGSEARADAVVSAGDGYATIYGMLDGKYTDERIRKYYAAVPAHQEMSVHVCLGVARDLSHEAHAITLILPEPLTIAGQVRERLDIELYGFDPTFAPAGKTAVKVLLDSSYTYWKDLLGDRARYEAEKQRVGEVVIGVLERRFPGLSQQIEVLDVATPVTSERFTGNFHGYQAWGAPDATILSSMSGKGLSTTLPGLANFYMVGQWAGATIGISTVAIAGRKLVQRLCRADGRRFATTKGA